MFVYTRSKLPLPFNPTSTQPCYSRQFGRHVHLLPGLSLGIRPQASAHMRQAQEMLPTTTLTALMAVHTCRVLARLSVCCHHPQTEPGQCGYHPWLGRASWPHLVCPAQGMDRHQQQHGPLRQGPLATQTVVPALPGAGKCSAAGEAIFLGAGNPFVGAQCTNAVQCRCNAVTTGSCPVTTAPLMFLCDGAEASVCTKLTAASLLTVQLLHPCQSVGKKQHVGPHLKQ